MFPNIPPWGKMFFLIPPLKSHVLQFKPVPPCLALFGQEEKLITIFFTDNVPPFVPEACYQVLPQSSLPYATSFQFFQPFLVSWFLRLSSLVLLSSALFSFLPSN